MPTSNELQLELSILRTRLNKIQAEIFQLTDRANELQRTFGTSSPEYQAAVARIQALQEQSNLVQSNISVVTVQIQQAQVDTRAREDAGPGTVSSGAVAIEAQTARDQSANTQNPEPAPGTATPIPTTVDRFVVNDDTNTDDPLRSIVSTQAIPPATAAFPIPAPDTLPPPGSSPDSFDQDGGPGLPNDTSAYPTTSPGVGAADDDSAEAQTYWDGQTNTGTDEGGGGNDITTLVNRTARLVTPRPNILDQCSSYTYSISIYIMSPEEYRTMLTTKKRYIPGSQLLIQSAGAPQSVLNSTASLENFDGTDANGELGRNQFFPLDYYIDDLEIKTLVPGKGTGGAHNVVDMRFKIVEPNGITLMDNLYKAAREYATIGAGAASKSTKNGNYGAQNYLMVIRYYGYDANGNLKTKLSTDVTSTSDANALVEKFIPFQFTGIKFRIANKLTEYECTGVCPQNTIATGQGRGVIPYNVELTATTLQNLFSGPVAWTDDGDTTVAPENASNAPNTTLSNGLTQALNAYQAELVADGTYEVADIYKVLISHPELANASIVPPSTIDRSSKPMVNVDTAAKAKDGATQSINVRAKTVSATAGTSILQFLDLAVRSSDYIYKQQTKIIDSDGKITATGNSASAFAWYRIGVEAKPIDKPDNKRNDLAYEITYEIAPYAVNDIKSEYFPEGKYRGSQKLYYYWFTGENTSVLSYEQDFNYLYYVTINSRTRATTSATADTSRTSNYRELEKRIFSPNSAQSNQGIEGNVNEPGANAADYLYSPSDQSRVKLSIVGDPAWIQQGELWSGVRRNFNNSIANTTGDPYFDPFLSDGTINFDAREAVFEIGFNKPADYNLDTGLMSPNAPGGEPSQSYIYKATQVTSHFRQGKFIQDIEGVLLLFPNSVATTKMLSAAADPSVLGSRNDEENTDQVSAQDSNSLLSPPDSVNAVNSGNPEDTDTDNTTLLPVNNSNPTSSNQVIGVSGDIVDLLNTDTQYIVKDE